MNLGWSLVSLLVFPGLLYAVPMAWLMLWVMRKVVARMQNRIGPPFCQPFFDFVKLTGKQPITRERPDEVLMTGLPVLAVAATLVAITLLPVFPGEHGFVGDLVLLVALLEVPPLCAVMAGFASRSIFGQVGAVREALLAVVYSVPFLGAVVALAASSGSLRLSDAVLAPPVMVRVPALVALFLCLPVKLRLNPFSVTNAEQEIYSGPLTEFDGPRLALWELAHGLELVTLIGLVVTLATPMRVGYWPVDALLFALFSLVALLVLATVSAATARLTLAHAGRFYMRWAFCISILALILAALPLLKG